MSISPDYFDKFSDIINKYMEPEGEGSTKASQIVTAVNILLYKWLNDGDVFDNQEFYEWSKDCCNDLSHEANWLDKYTDLSYILSDIDECATEDDYSELLKKLADAALNEEYLIPYAKQNAVDSIYTCKGYYQLVSHYEEEDEEEDW